MMMMMYNLQLPNAETFVYPRKFECKKTFRVNALLATNLNELATLHICSSNSLQLFSTAHTIKTLLTMQ